MAIIPRFKQWREHRRQGMHAKKLAEQAFLSTRSGSKIAWTAEPQLISDGDYVVVVCHGDTRPPSRTWWRVGIAAGTVHEMTETEASALVPVKPWR